MRKVHFISVLMCMIFYSASTFAQLMPNNNDLTDSSLARWMQSNHSMELLMDAIDSELTTPELYDAFESLSSQQQDAKIAEILAHHQLDEQALRVVRQYGWKSVGEFRRYGNKLGNAIAAYFVSQDVDGLEEAQKILVLERMDPVVLSVSQDDINFIAAHEDVLSKYIQSYKSSL